MENKYMLKAIELAKVAADEGEVPVGAVVVKDGEIIATGNSIDLNDYEDQLGCYIRFQLKGEGGITYSQAFTLSYEGRADKEIPHYAKFDGFFGDVFKKLVKTRFFAIIMKICEKFDYDIVGAIAKY